MNDNVHTDGRHFVHVKLSDAILNLSFKSSNRNRFKSVNHIVDCALLSAKNVKCIVRAKLSKTSRVL